MSGLLFPGRMSCSEGMTPSNNTGLFHCFSLVCFLSFRGDVVRFDIACHRGEKSPLSPFWWERCGRGNETRKHEMRLEWRFRWGFHNVNGVVDVVWFGGVN